MQIFKCSSPNDNNILYYNKLQNNVTNKSGDVSRKPWANLNEIVFPIISRIIDHIMPGIHCSVGDRHNQIHYACRQYLVLLKQKVIDYV